MNDVSSSIDASLAEQQAKQQREHKAIATEYARRKEAADAFLQSIEVRLTQVISDVIRSGNHLFSVELHSNSNLAKELVQQIMPPRYWWENITFPLLGVHNSGVAWEGVYWLRSWDNPLNTPAGTPPNNWCILVVHPPDLFAVTKTLIIPPLVDMIKALDGRLEVRPPCLDFDRILVSLRKAGPS